MQIDELQTAGQSEYHGETDDFCSPPGTHQPAHDPAC
jgi:hypothetical protein